LCACHQATFIFLVGGHVHVHRVALLLCIAAVHHAPPEGGRVTDRSLRLRHTASDQSAALPRPCASLSTCCPGGDKRIPAVQSDRCRSSPFRPPATARGVAPFQEPAEPTLARMAVSRATRSDNRRCAIPALWRPVPTPLSSRDLTSQVCLGNPISVARSAPYVKYRPAPRSMMMGPAARKSMIHRIADYVK